MVFSVADRLCTAIEDFLIECGGIYEKENGELEKTLLEALRLGQFVIKINDKGVRYFACYWLIKPEDVFLVMNRVHPVDVSHGSIVYILEAASKEGLKGVILALKRKLKCCDGIMWDRHGKGVQVFTKTQHRRG